MSLGLRWDHKRRCRGRVTGGPRQGKRCFQFCAKGNEKYCRFHARDKKPRVSRRMGIYSQAMGSTLQERVNYIQASEQANGHPLRCLEELSLARDTLAPIVKLYSDIVDAPLDNPKNAAILIELGSTLRSALHEIMAMATKASRLEQDIKMLHDPRFTMMFIKNLVETLEREAIAEEGNTSGFKAENFVRRVNDRVQELNRFSPDATSEAVKSPAQLCLEMDASIGAA